MSHASLSHDWFHQKVNKRTKEIEGKSNNMHYTREIIYSWGDHYRLASIVYNPLIPEQKIVMFSNHTYARSSSTGKQGGNVISAIDFDAVKFFRVTSVLSQDEAFSGSLKDHKYNVEDLVKEVKELEEKHSRARTWSHKDEIYQRIQTIRDYQHYFSLTERGAQDSELTGLLRWGDVEAPETAALLAKVEEREAVIQFNNSGEQQEIAKQKREAKLARSREEVLPEYEKTLKLWREGKLNSNSLSKYSKWFTQVRLRAIAAKYSQHTRVVETSLSASVSYDDAKKLFDIVYRLRDKSIEHSTLDKLNDILRSEMPNIGSFGPATIRPNGDIKIGCHLIEYSEALQLAQAEGWVDSIAVVYGTDDLILKQ